MAIEGLYLMPGMQIRLVKLEAGKDSHISVGTSLEGVLDADVRIGQPIYLDGKTKNTSRIQAVKKDGDRVFLKTETSVYELVPPTSDGSSEPKSKERIELEHTIETLLKEVQANAVDEKIVGSLIERRHQLGRQEKTDASKIELQKIDTELEKHIVTVKTIAEFKLLMEKIGRNYYAVMGTVAHENAHANMASSLGAIHSGYSLLVTRKGNDFSYQPIALTNVRGEWDKKDQLEANIKIAGAPKEYGNKLSPGDEEMIASLRKQLNNL